MHIFWCGNSRGFFGGRIEVDTEAFLDLLDEDSEYSNADLARVFGSEWMDVADAYDALSNDPEALDALRAGRSAAGVTDEVVYGVGYSLEDAVDAFLDASSDA